MTSQNKRRRSDEIRERNRSIAESYRNGVLLKDIATAVGLSRQRVQQILADVGITRYQGGQHIAKKAALDAKAVAHSQRYLKAYGCTYEQLEPFLKHPDRPLLHYRRFKRNHQSRVTGEWRLTFLEWWSLWQASGKWALRGRGHGTYALRIGDRAKPISIENVTVVSYEEACGPGSQRRPRKSAST